MKRQVKYWCDLSAKDFLNCPSKAITLLGMSGVGKTTLANQLPSSNWFKYSGDYRIGTRYLDEAILDNIKLQAMKTPFLADLLRTDSIYICHNITINNLYPVSSFLGKVGNPSPEHGGLLMDEFLRRQALHHDAEVQSMYDVPSFIEKGKSVYEYPNFINDAGGSLCDLQDHKIYPMLAEHSLIVYIKTTETMIEQLVERSENQPKPMYYQRSFFEKKVKEYCTINDLSSIEQMIPDDFIRWIFPYLIRDRLPRYEKIAQQYGVTLEANSLEGIQTEGDFLEAIAMALTNKQKNHI